MSNQATYVKQATTLFIALACIALSSMGSADSVVEKKKPANIADEELFFAPVPKAVCGPGDKPETGLQGQVAAPLRAAGFQGFSCNLTLLSQVRGEGANWQTTEWREGKGKTKKVCAYHGTAAPTASTMPRSNLGTRVIDVSNPSAPVTTAYLTTSAMLDPWESLKINERRQLLGAVNGQNGGLAGSGSGGPEIDVYDVSGDCRYPQLLASVPVGLAGGGGIIAPVVGHEGSWAPDGLTYYGSGSGGYYAVDTSDTTKPKLLAVWHNPPSVGGGHGLSISDDGLRGYHMAVGFAATNVLLDPTVPATNGFVIYDLSQIQARQDNPQPLVIGTVTWKDGNVGQHTIPITQGKRSYIIGVDEGGSGGLPSTAVFAQTCAADQPAFPMARIIDITDEKNPKIVSKLMLEVHDPANCDAVAPDVAGLNTFIYGSHYCSVDNRKNATTLACGYFNSGIRVFDIRDPIRPREIAYYNPAGVTTASPGSNHASIGQWKAGGPDWCSAQVHMDAENGTLWSTCQDNGLLMMKFTHNAWPFAETRTPPGRQN